MSLYVSIKHKIFFFFCAVNKFESRPHSFLSFLDHSQLDTHTHTHARTPVTNLLNKRSVRRESASNTTNTSTTNERPFRQLYLIL